MNFLKGNAVAVIALLVAILGCYLPVQQAAVVTHFGGVTNYDEVDATAVKIGGANGSRVGPVITGFGTLISNAFTVTASSTLSMDIAITGVVSGDVVDAWFATSTANGGGWAITGSSASSTSGYITVRVANNTGANAVVPQSLASSTVPYLIIHPVTSVPGL